VNVLKGYGFAQSCWGLWLPHTAGLQPQVASEVESSVLVWRWERKEEGGELCCTGHSCAKW
jgi:hypothetical protein